MSHRACPDISGWIPAQGRDDMVGVTTTVHNKAGKTKSPARWPGFSNSSRIGLDAEALEAFLEARNAAAAVEQLARAAGPGPVEIGRASGRERVGQCG